MRESCDNSYKLQILVVRVLASALQHIVGHMIRGPLTRTWLKGNVNDEHIDEVRARPA